MLKPAPAGFAQQLGVIIGSKDQEDDEMSGISSSTEQSSDEEGEEEDGLDEDYFAHQEDKFLHEMKLLAAKKPPLLLEDPVIVSLLLRIQMLGMIADGAVPLDLQHDSIVDDMPMATEEQPLGLPSPKAEEETRHSPKPSGRLLKEDPPNPIPTPPLEDLPFLINRVEDDLEDDIEVFDSPGSEADEEPVGTFLQQQLVEDLRNAQLKVERLRDEFEDQYRDWKSAVIDLENKKRGESAVTPAPASPPSSAAQANLLIPSIERTRSAKNTTELDLQNILRASELSAREEQEKRDREATSKPNSELEAEVPEMLDGREVENFSLEDRNWFVKAPATTNAYIFAPPQDDFTPDEQKTFITAFCSTPKKWGKIAEDLPERGYRQCILHYYLTKDEAKYKEYFRRPIPRKGRRKGANSRLRSTALISDLVLYGDEMESTPTAVTDTGRPRRAAAPTFGDAVTDSDGSALAPSSNRRTAILSKEGNGEAVVEKVTGRGRRAGTGTKTRRTKAQMQPAQLAPLPVPDGVLTPSPQKLERPISQSMMGSRGMPRANAGGGNVEERQSLDSQYQMEAENCPPQSLGGPPDSSNPATTVMAAANAPPSSYWSVPEQTKFLQLIAHFGRDFEAIANFMKTKTTTMVGSFRGRRFSPLTSKTGQELLSTSSDY
jgi:hypothetical protein